MSELELTEILKAMYTKEPKEKTRMKFLFGVQYAAELKNKNIRKIAEGADGKSDAASEINKGISLTKYVEINSVGKALITEINNDLAKNR